MNEIKNRISLNANRRKIKIIEQNANEILADIELADSPIEEGTAITASFLNEFQTNLTNICTSTANTALNTANEALNRTIESLGTKIYSNNNLLDTWNCDTKVNVSDIVDNLNSTNANVPLSANQGFELKNLYNTILTKLDNFLDKVYPVGSIYFSTNDCSPAELFGGTWKRVAEGRTIYGAGSLNGNIYTNKETKNAGLPNIEAYFSAYSWLLGSGEGAIESFINNTNQVNGSSENKNWCGYNFSAQKSNSIYGNSTTVQPDCYIVNIWERIQDI